MRSCCGRSIRQGVFLSTVFLFAIFSWNFGILVFFYTHPSAVFFIGELREILMDSTTEFAIVCSGMTLTLGLALVFLPPSHGLAMPVKVLGAMVVVSGFGWLIAGVTLGRRLNAFFLENLPSTTLMRGAMDSLQKGGKMAIPTLIGSVVAGSVLNNVAIDAAVRLLGEPLSWCVYAGMNPFLPVAVFGIAPVIHALSSVAVIMSYGGVLEAGGDGSEYVEADRVEWFYSLSKKEQHKIQDARGHYTDSDDDDDSDDSSEDEDGEDDSEGSDDRHDHERDGDEYEEHKNLAPTTKHQGGKGGKGKLATGNSGQFSDEDDDGNYVSASSSVRQQQQPPRAQPATKKKLTSSYSELI